MYTPAQAAEHLGIASSTLRKYSRMFETYLSEQSNRQHRRYTGHDLEVLSKVIILREQGIALDEIKRQLSSIPEDGLLPTGDLERPVGTSVSESPAYLDDIRHSIENLADNFQDLSGKVYQENRQLEETVTRLTEEIHRIRRELEIFKEDRDQEQTRLKQDLQNELKTILADLQAARNEMLQSQPNPPTDPPIAQENIRTEMIQLRAEIYRLKEAQKRIEQRIKALSDRVDTPFWKRAPKSPMEA